MSTNNAINNTLATPFTVGSTSVTSTGTQLNLLNALTLVPITQIKTAIATTSATYTPTTGMKFVTVLLVGGGGGGGGAAGVAATSSGMGGGGAGGGACYKTYTAALLGATAAIVIGGGGAGGASGNNNGSDGVDSTFTPAGAGVVLTASHGIHGNGSAAVVASGSGGLGGSGGTGTNGDYNLTGGYGNRGVIINGAVGVATGGDGGNSILGSSNFFTNISLGGQNGVAYGQGGTGGFGQLANAAGGNGLGGICIITEYISA